MYKYLKKKNTISNEEIDVILKLISINHIHIAMTALSCIGLHDRHPQFENVIRLILEHIVNNSVVRTIYLLSLLLSFSRLIFIYILGN